MSRCHRVRLITTTSVTETVISKEVNVSNEEVMEEDLLCLYCQTLEKENRRLRNRIVTLKSRSAGGKERVEGIEGDVRSHARRYYT